MKGYKIAIRGYGQTDVLITYVFGCNAALSPNVAAGIDWAGIQICKRGTTVIRYSFVRFGVRIGTLPCLCILGSTEAGERGMEVRFSYLVGCSVPGLVGPHSAFATEFGMGGSPVLKQILRPSRRSSQPNQPHVVLSLYWLILSLVKSKFAAMLEHESSFWTVYWQRKTVSVWAMCKIL